MTDEKQEALRKGPYEAPSVVDLGLLFEMTKNNTEVDGSDAFDGAAS
jgi:hypothetical protein